MSEEPAMSHAATLTERAGAEVLLREPPADDSLRYRLAWAGRVLRSLATPHRLRVAQARPLASLHWVRPGHASGWRALFGCLGRPDAPLLCSQSALTLLHLRLANQLGVDLRHALHLAHRAHHPTGTAALGATGVQVVRAALQGAWRVGPGKAVVTLRSQVHDARGSVIAALEDDFIVRKLPAADLAGLPESSALVAELLRQARRRPQMHGDTPGAATAAIALPAQFGRDLAALSGELSPVHTSRIGALMAGHRRPFAQTGALRHLVAARLHELGWPVARYTIHFSAPAALGQTLGLVVNGGRFELTDAQGTLVAWGEC
jgi:hypothetical protein